MLAMSHASLARVFASLDARRRPARAVARRQSVGLSCRAVVGDDARDDTARANAPSRRAFVHMLSLASVASVTARCVLASRAAKSARIAASMTSFARYRAFGARARRTATEWRRSRAAAGRKPKRSSGRVRPWI